MADITLQIPFTIRALDGEEPAETAARVALGLKAAVCYLNRVGRPYAQVGETPLADDAERIAAVDALTQEELVGIVVAELRSHVQQLIVGESAHRANAAAEAARQATQAQVEASFG